AKQDEVLPKWIWHWISTSYFKKYVEENQSGSAYPAISDAKVKECYIPVPCPENPGKSLAIQSEIVRILDKFTALTAELTAELTARKKQYNYYRDQLLSFEGGSVEWKSLGEVAIITIGAFVRKDKQNPDADYPVYNGGRTPTGYYEDFNNDGDKIIVSARGANAGFVNKSSTPYWAGNSCYSISVRSTEQLHWMYVYYYLKQSETKLTGIQQKGGIPAVSKKQMEDLLLPIPSKSEQVRIVTILDKFDTLTSSITEGLPREIELRQKQYEYYRDLLFSFPKPDAVSH
ncbi:restriction endonuclease subunit S, partial [Klebsiella pneumoniae]